MKKITTSILTFSLMQIATLSAAVFTYTLDSASDFDATGTVVFKNTNTNGSGSSTAPSNPISSITDPTSETPNQLRFTSEIEANDRVMFLHYVTSATITPSVVGGITNFDFTLDVNDPNLGNSDSPLHFGLEQDGNRYFYATGSSAFQFRNAGSTSFATFDLNGLDQTDFAFYDASTLDGVNTSSNPDFSASGSNIQFFLGGVASTNNGSTFTRVTDFRNAEIELTTVAIPEPSTFGLMAGALALSSLMHRRRRRH
jgi:hypothetical protein